MLRMLLLAIGLLWSMAGLASSPSAIWVRVDKVTQDMAAKPMTVRIDGTFVYGKDAYSDNVPAVQGYVFYACPAGQDAACMMEWGELAKAAGGKSCNGLGGQDSPPGTVHAADEVCKQADVYPIQNGIHPGSYPCMKMDSKENPPLPAAKTCDAGPPQPDAGATEADAGGPKADVPPPQDVPAPPQDVPPMDMQMGGTDATPDNGQTVAPPPDAGQDAGQADTGTLQGQDTKTTTTPAPTAKKSSGCTSSPVPVNLGWLGLLAGLVLLRRRLV